ncbi:unnamed protein product [Parnassius apollo]|uniref:(apollo) hypothetical protein n=1 Tax=Parnassius apollo TaxID=110799 RepID=A0A8S3XVR8_PARAO|nr:unnamed protein product [Parnassius apollo]
MSRTTRKKLKDDDIENMLMRLEAGEISEDDAESDEDDLDFYPSRKDLQAVLEDKEVSDEEEVPETEECPDPPLVHEEIYQQASTSRSNVFPQINTRNLIWKKRSLEYKEESIAFLGSTELGPELMKLETPLQFFSQYFSEDLLKKIVEETNKYSTQTNIDRPVQISLTELRKYLGILIFIEESLKKAVNAVQNKQSSLKQASEQYGIPISTLSRKSREVSEFGFLFDLLDLRVLAQRYLSKIGRNIPSLNNNMPGKDWAINFMMRHKNQISFRLTNNISSARAEITKEIIEKFFDNFEPLCNDISPDRIINYNETNLTDDPGSKKLIWKRGKKYPERIMDSTKSAISIMFAGAGDGTLLNPYVVYKAEHLWDTWITGGPPDTHYNRSRSGWFDSVCFEDWFTTVIVPRSW